MLLALVVVVLLVSRGPRRAVLPPNRPPPHSGTALPSREDDAARLLNKLTTRLTDGSKQQTLALAAPGDRQASRELSAIFDNVRGLPISHLRMRYVDEDAGQLTAGQQQRLGQKGWVGDVALEWRIRGYETGISSMQVNLAFAETSHGAAFVSARGDYGDAAPLWLLDRVRTEHSRRSLVMVTGAEHLDTFASEARRAVTDVRLVLPAWKKKLVLEVPASQEEMDRTLGSDEHAYDAIAAVTSTADGSMDRSAPTHVFVNPDVFDKLGRRGAQIVVSHEATHVATGAAVSSMPTWLLEGFADYVALAHAGLPVPVTASQILRDVRKIGVPEHLPGAAEFDPANPVLGASYEAAWLACRLLAQEYGEQKLIAFYRGADRDSSTRHAFPDVLGTTEQSFTRQWQDYLEQLAS